MQVKQDRDPILVKLKEKFRDQKVVVFSQGGNGVLRCQVRLCILCVDGLR